jgi:uncharacterized membrane protein
MSERAARTATMAVALVGIAVAGYLTWVHYTGLAPICTGISDCERVQSSDYAQMGGVPVALAGLVGYAAIFLAAVLKGTVARMAGLYLALTGAGFSIYLTWVELAQIDAICQWCVTSAALMIVLAAIALLRRDGEPAATPARGSRAPRARTRARGSHRASRRARASR